MRQVKTFIFIVLLSVVSVVSVFGAAGDVDQTFAAATGGAVNPTPSTALQPDGKILVFGSFHNINGVARHKFWRLNADGTIDNSFNCACENFNSVESAVAQADGKIMIGGYGVSQNFTALRFARLNADGSADASFDPYFLQSTISVSTVRPIVWAVQPDGKPLVSYFTSGSFLGYSTLVRLNADGSVDNTFASLQFNERFNTQYALNQLQILPGGKIMIGGRHSFGDIFRINPDGSKDESFVAPILTNGSPSFYPKIYTFGFQSTGKIVISGDFTTVNGISRNGFARLNADGSLDLQFTSSVSNVQKLVIVSGDKILLGTARLNSDGSVDPSYGPAFSFFAWHVDLLERIVFVGNEAVVPNTKQIGRMNSDGSADNSFNFALIESRGEVTSIALQPDGKVLFGGIFTRVNGIVRRSLTRVNADGTVDPTFNSGTGVGFGAINIIVVQPDGKILIGGTFSSYNDSTRLGLARINADGSLDAAFNPVLASSGSVNVPAIALQTDGKILIGGNFTTVNSETRTSLARLNADGSLDNSFNPILGTAYVASIVVQADGKIMIGGTFAGVNGVNRSNFARLNADASLDSSFNAGTIAGVSQIVQTADGKYLVLTNTVLRRNNDGTADGSFPAITPAAPPGGNSAFIRRFLLQADGSIVLVGEFGLINQIPRRNIARIKPGGGVDPVFFPTGANGTINTITAQTDGKLIVGGAFSTIENVPRSGIARLISPAVPSDANFDFDGDGKADVSVFRPSENKWYVLKSSDLTVLQQVFAIAGDVPVPADYDGDGKTDFAIYRPSAGDWWSLSSQTGAQIYAHWGASGAIPRPSDFDGDGRADYIYFLPSNSTWYRYGSVVGFAAPVTFGLAGDKPVTGDFDGDRKSDVAIYRPSTGDWWWKSSASGAQLATHWGISTDIPAPADFDSDGKTDFCVYRALTGTWYIINSNNGSFTIMNFGISEDKPVPADYDGDRKADVAVFRPLTGAWYLQRTTAGFWALNWGIATDIPVENAFVP